VQMALVPANLAPGEEDLRPGKIDVLAHDDYESRFGCRVHHRHPPAECNGAGQPITVAVLPSAIATSPKNVTLKAIASQ
jgi:hypothetical protein